jgi:hypothetical protein
VLIHHAINAYVGVEVELHTFLISALDRQIVGFLPRSLPIRKENRLGWVKLGGWVTTRTGEDVEDERKRPASYGN